MQYMGRVRLGFHWAVSNNNGHVFGVDSRDAWACSGWSSAAETFGSGWCRRAHLGRRPCASQKWSRCLSTGPSPRRLPAKHTAGFQKPRHTPSLSVTVGFKCRRQMLDCVESLANILKWCFFKGMFVSFLFWGERLEDVKRPLFFFFLQSLDLELLYFLPSVFLLHLFCLIFMSHASITSI